MQRNCPVCECAASESIFDNVMYPIGNLDMSYAVSQCGNCGFFFASRLPGDDVYSQYYESLSKYDGTVGRSSIDLERVARIGAFCEIHLDKSNLVLDIGCGSGLLLAELQKRGWSNLLGVDPSPNTTKTATFLFGLTGIQSGTLANVHELVDLEKVDAIFMMAVLEHLPQLREDLKSILSKVRIGCKVLVEVPSISRFNGLAGEAFGEFSLEHIQYFSKSSLQNLFSSLGGRALAIEDMQLSVNDGGDLLGLFVNEGCNNRSAVKDENDGAAFFRYIEESGRRLNSVLAKIPPSPIIVYGAGSHTARLLPHLAHLPDCEVVTVVDSNPNLIGKTIGRWCIEHPDCLHAMPDIPIVVSSFRSQNAIAESLRQRLKNRLILLY